MNADDISVPAAVKTFLASCGCGTEASLRTGVLETFYWKLVEGNRKQNLTRLVSPEDFWFKHVADSCSLGLVFPAVFAQPLRLADVGSGGGFPIGPLAWGNPELNATVIESSRKKADFLTDLFSALQFGHVRVISLQVREAANREPSCREGFDIVTARAVTNAGRFIKHARSLLSPGGCIVLYKTPQTVDEEYDEALREARKYDLTLAVSRTITLPEEKGERRFIFVKRD